MELSTVLAEILVDRLVKEAAPDVLALRNAFEDSASREKLLRSHAMRWKDLADSRAGEEDQSLAGYAGTGLSRLTPVPHTGGEAMLRLPLIGGAAAYGYNAASKLKPMDPGELERVTKPVSPKDQPLRYRLQQVMSEGMNPADRSEFNSITSGKGKAFSPGGASPAQTVAQNLDAVTSHLGSMPGSDVSRVLQEDRFLNPAPEPKHLQARQLIEQHMGPGGVQRLRGEMANVIKQTSKQPKGGLIPSITPKMNWHGVAGGLAAGGLASVATGIPYAVKALYQKRFGGEAAERARQEARGNLDQAQLLSGQRDDILQQLPGLKPSSGGPTPPGALM